MKTVIKSALSLSILGAFASSAFAVDYMGTVDFEGTIDFPAPIPGITAADLTIRVKDATEATGNGEKCSITASSSDNADVGGNFPDAGAVSADLLIERGGPNIPDGDCIVTLVAEGNDGVSTSARGTLTVFVPAADIQAASTLMVGAITVRASKAVASVDSTCLRWFKKQSRKRRACNRLALLLGPAAAARCKDAGPEPAGCDDGDHAEAILALSHGQNDQQVDPGTAEAVDRTLLRDQLRCQNKISAAAMRYAFKRIAKVNKTCLKPVADSDACREQASVDSRRPLNGIDKCVIDQLVDGGTGRAVPDVGAPCDVCISGGQLDRKCLKSCFELTIGELTDGFVGDVPICGNGLLQPGEFCDDGNLVNGDGCSDTCTVE